ncbi:MAG: hypothetical protein M1434_04750 [Chloroflexi bacterium]|nr:hypothetical protein [Chloroflexota bacterium]MCL5274042.1 hypothetical protein [Chloroflexota bacterium]
MFRIRRFVVVAAAVALGGVGAVTVMASGAGAIFSPQKSVSVVPRNGVQGYSDIDNSWDMSGTITSTGSFTQSDHNDDMDMDWDVSGTMTSTNPYTHSNRVALSIALEFSVSVTSVVDLHNSGWGYGEIFKLYEFAQVSGKTPDEIQAMRTSGLGWGQIAQALGIKVGEGNGHGKDGDVISGSEWLSGTVVGDPGKWREHDNEDSHGSSQQGQVGKGEDHGGRSNSGNSSTNNGGAAQHQQNNSDNKDSSSSTDTKNSGAAQHQQNNSDNKDSSSSTDTDNEAVTLKVSNSNSLLNIQSSNHHDSIKHESGEKGDD